MVLFVIMCSHNWKFTSYMHSVVDTVWIVAWWQYPLKEWHDLYLAHPDKVITCTALMHMTDIDKACVLHCIHSCWYLTTHGIWQSYSKVYLSWSTLKTEQISWNIVTYPKHFFNPLNIGVNFLQAGLILQKISAQDLKAQKLFCTKNFGLLYYIQYIAWCRWRNMVNYHVHVQILYPPLHCVLNSY